MKNGSWKWDDKQDYIPKVFSELHLAVMKKSNALIDRLPWNSWRFARSGWPWTWFSIVVMEKSNALIGRLLWTFWRFARSGWLWTWFSIAEETWSMNQRIGAQQTEMKNILISSGDLLHKREWMLGYSRKGLCLIFNLNSLSTKDWRRSDVITPGKRMEYS